MCARVVSKCAFDGTISPGSMTAPKKMLSAPRPWCAGTTSGKPSLVDGVPEALEAPRAGVRLVAPKQRGPLLRAHRTRARVGQQIELDVSRRERKRFQPAFSSARSRSARVVSRTGSTILMRKGSRGGRTRTSLPRDREGSETYGAAKALSPLLGKTRCERIDRGARLVRCSLCPGRRRRRTKPPRAYRTTSIPTVDARVSRPRRAPGPAPRPRPGPPLAPAVRRRASAVRRRHTSAAGNARRARGAVRGFGGFVEPAGCSSASTAVPGCAPSRATGTSPSSRRPPRAVSGAFRPRRRRERRARTARSIWPLTTAPARKSARQVDCLVVETARFVQLVQLAERTGPHVQEP